MNALKKLNSIFYFISKKLGAFVLGTLVVVITIAVIARYFLGQQFTWTEELCTFLFIWFSFLGATLATYEKRHVSVDFLVTKLPKQVNNVVKLLSNILILAFFVLLVVGAFILFPTMQHVSVALRIPKYCYYFPIALSSVMMFCMYLADTIEFVKEWMNEGKEVQKI